MGTEFSRPLLYKSEWKESISIMSVVPKISSKWLRDWELLANPHCFCSFSSYQFRSDKTNNLLYFAKLYKVSASFSIFGKELLRSATKFFQWQKEKNIDKTCASLKYSKSLSKHLSGIFKEIQKLLSPTFCYLLP